MPCPRREVMAGWFRIGLMIAVSGSQLVQAGKSLQLVTFGKLSELALDRYSLRTAQAIEADVLNPGGFLVGNQHSLALISPGLSVRILAGRENDTAFRNGVGRQAYFEHVQHISQFNSGADIVLADYGNHCIRKVDRTGRVTTFAGKCTVQGHVNGTEPALQAHMTNPVGTLPVEKQKLFYYLLYQPDTILKHDLTTGTLQILFKDLDNFRGTFSFVADSEYKYLYVTHDGGISKIDVSNGVRTVVTGTNKTTVANPKSVDGSLLQARFMALSGMQWLIQDQVLIACQFGDRSLRIVNLVDDQVSTICKGPTDNNYRFKLGDLDECEMNDPTPVSVVDGAIYIGESTGKDSTPNPSRGHILKLEYYQPICGPPPSADLKGTFSPMLDRYTHLQTISYTCHRGFGINTEYSTIKCVPAHHPNGTVYGEWDKPAPVCQKADLSFITPTSGQRGGGTVVVMTGTFPLQGVTVSVRYSNNEFINVSFSSRSHKLITFEMPPKISSSNDQVKIHTLFGVERMTNTLLTDYTYLPNPAATQVSRTSSIASGGLRMTFKVENALSAKMYTLKVFRRVQDPPVATMVCAAEQRRVNCVTPNVQSVFSDKAKRSAEVKQKTLTAGLYSDGKPVSGADNLQFLVVNTKPHFIPRETQFDIWTESIIIVSGSDLNISLSTSDYAVMLEMEDTGARLPCEVIQLSRTELHCTPPTKDITIPRYKYSRIATVKVEVAGANMTAGKVTFYSSSSVTDQPQVSTPKPGRDLVSIIVPTVVGVAVIIVAVVLYFVIRRWLTNQQPLLPPPDNKDALPVFGLEQQISSDLKVKLEDMYIESIDLSFDPKSEPIGKGHFGKVYIGQLQLKGNILKTVAVKTLKETDDINIDQIEEFLEEASFLKYYKHVNILTTLGIVWRKGDRPNVVLPYMAMGDICGLVRKPEMLFTNGDLLHFGMQVACGMEYLTNNKCLHRDLAARNCLVSDTFLVKIADFGMSRDVYTDNYYRESSWGKPKPIKWMALESLREAVYNAQTEVWSFGVLLWELLTRGQIPYSTVPQDEMVIHLMSGHRLPRPIYCHPAVFSELAKCWDSSPDSRPTFTQLKEFLEECVVSKAEKFTQQTLKDSIEAGDSFRYSYVRDRTRLIPTDYVETGVYEEDIKGAVNYVDISKNPPDYELALPIRPAPASFQQASVQGLESLSNNVLKLNEYTSEGCRQTAQEIPDVYTVNNRQALNGISQDLNEDSPNAHNVAGSTAPIPTPRISLGKLLTDTDISQRNNSYKEDLTMC